MTAAVRTACAGALAVVTVAVLASAAWTPAAASAAPTVRLVAGTPGGKVDMRRTSDRLSFAIAWSARCADGGRPFRGVTRTVRPMRLRRGGRSAVGTATFTGKGADGVVVTYRATLRVRRAGAALRGQWRMSVAGPTTDGRRYSCSTGPVRWRAKPVKRVKRRRAARTAPRAAATQKLKLRTAARSPGRRAPARPPAVPAPSAPPAAAPSAPAAGGEYRGTVTYRARDCRTGPERSVALGGARVVLTDAAGHAVQGTLDASGAYAVRVPGPGPVHVRLVLDGSDVQVTPDRDGEPPYAVALGTASPDAVARSGDGTPIHVTPHEVTGDGPAGAANIFAVLSRSARVARDDGGLAGLAKVTARWRFDRDLTRWLGDVDGSHYDPSANEIHVGGLSGGGGSKRDEWEAYVLAHEYGHHVMEQRFPPPDRPAAHQHSLTSVHPADPALPLSEGFAHFFAATVLESGKLTLGCTTRADFGAAPATPAPVAPRQTQYNETRIAGALFTAAGWLGGHDVRKGLRPIVEVFQHRPPSSARELADAAASKGAHELGMLLGGFTANDIGWGASVSVGVEDLREDGIAAAQAVQVVVEGPGGMTCEFTGTGGRMQQGTGWTGPLAGVVDDCHLVSSDGAPPPVDEGASYGGGGATIAFPHLSGGAHLAGTYVVKARWLCTSLPADSGYPANQRTCTSDRAFRASADRGYADRVQTDIIKLTSTFRTIARYNGRGWCEVLGSSGALDCSV